MKLAWYAKRLSRMSPAEIAGRTRDLGVKAKWRRRQVLDARRDPLPVPRQVPDFASPILAGPVGAGQNVPEALKQAILVAAERVRQGRCRVFGLELRHDTPAPDWTLDVRTGHQAPAEAYTFDLDIRDVSMVGTIKYVWEPSRHHHLTLMAAAYHLSGDERFAEAVEAQLTDWWHCNPFLTGVHWTSGIEIGVRLISWVWIRRLLDGWKGARGLFEDNPICLQQLHHHQEYLRSLPSHGSSANNHLIAELAGLHAAACAFPWFRESKAWRKWAARGLNKEIARQTFACGLNREMASDYHGFVLELALAAAIEGELGGAPLAPEAWHVLCRMMDATAAVLDSTKQPPRQGDSDDALGLLVDVPEANRWSSLLNTGKSLFGAPAWWPRPDGPDLRSLLFTALLPKAPAIPSDRPAVKPALLEDAGMAILRSGGGETELWCRCDHGPHGFLSIAAHGHADALSVEVRYGGVELLADPGTYTYQGEPEWRSYFRSTLGHNTLELAGEDQSLSAGPFLWTRHAKARLLSTEGLDSGPVAEWTAEHDGYARLMPGAIHRRHVTLHRADQRLQIQDSLDCSGEHPCRLSYHLGPEIDCVLDGTRARLRWRNAAGEQMAAELRLPAELVWSLHRGESTPPLGWHSSHFGEKRPSFALVGHGRAGARSAFLMELAVFGESKHQRSTELSAFAG